MKDDRPVNGHNWSAGVLYFGLFFMSFWTVACHATVFLGLPYSALLALFIVSICAAGIALWWLCDLQPKFRPVPLIPISLTGSSKRVNGALLVALIGFVCTLALFYKFTAYQPFWVFLIATGIATFLYSKPKNTLNNASSSHKTATRTQVLIFPALVSTMLVLLYLGTSVPDADDALFINLAVGAKLSGNPVFAFDTMMGVDTLPFMKSTYKLESYQLLAAVISSYLGIDVLFAAHTVLPTLMLIWGACTILTIHLWLFRGHWVFTSAAHIAFTLILDGSLQSYGQHGLLRFFQGKGPFVTVMIPLVVFLAYQACNLKSKKIDILLGLCFIASLGMTANGLYAAPLACALVIAPAFLMGEAKTKLRLARLGLTLLYPVFLAAYLLIFDPPGPSEFESAGTVAGGYWSIAGSPLGFAIIGLSFFALAISGIINTRYKLYSLYLVLILLGVFNPFLWDLYGSVVTGNINSRLFWAIPIPLFLSFALLLALFNRAYYYQIFCLGALFVLTLLPNSILNKANLGFTAYKVPAVEYSAAKKIGSLVGEHALILAPEEISTWLPTLEQQIQVIESRGLYLPQRQHQFSERQLAERSLLFSWASNTDSDAEPDIWPLLDQYKIPFIALHEEHKANNKLSNYSRMKKVESYWLYVIKSET